ncbi:MAG: dihydrodipicolinate synthase family protein [Clostridia bacterium]|nr:dihydrodipicolinate synthase family protein [Clostridia bacterium]
MNKARYYCPSITVFDEDCNVDIEGCKKHWEFLIEKGISGIIVMGSAGEFWAIPADQKKALIDAAVETINHRVPLIIGTGNHNYKDMIALSNYAIDKGADGIIIVGTTYFAPDAAGIEQYFGKAADQIHGDIYIYNFPGVTGYDVSPQITLNLLRKHKNIVGYKDTVRDMNHTRELLNTVLPEFPEFICFSGYDDNFAHNMLCGGRGGISGLSNLYPEIFAAWVDAANSSDAEAMYKLQRVVNRMCDLYAVHTNFMPMVKKGLQLRGLDINDKCSEPFQRVTDTQTEAIKTIMADVEAMF